MKKHVWSSLRRHARRIARSLLAALPGSLRFALYRRTVDCEPVTQGRLELAKATQRWSVSYAAENALRSTVSHEAGHVRGVISRRVAGCRLVG